MRSQARLWFVTMVCGLLLAAFAPALADGFGIEKFAAVNCNAESRECATLGGSGYDKYYPVEPTAEKAEKEGFRQAGGRVPFGVTTFKLDTEGAPKHEFPAGLIVVKEGKPALDATKIPVHIRTDVAPGLATDPFAPAQCSVEAFTGTEIAEGAFTPPTGCPAGSLIGEQHAVIYDPEKDEAEGGEDVALSGAVYNLAPGEGKWASKFGVALDLEPLIGIPLVAHTIINGNVEWGKQAAGTQQSDFHDYFEIEVSPKLPLVASRLSFFGNVGKNGVAGEGGFITNATNCFDPEDLATRLAITDLGGETATQLYKEPVGLTGCPLSFNPGFAFTSGANGSEQPNQFTATASLEHKEDETDQSQVRTASFTLPEGMTLNPSAAKNLSACTEAQAHLEDAAPSREGSSIWGPQFGVECPASSKIGTVTLEVPTLPPGSLKGDVYLLAPDSGTITGPPYDMVVVANSAEYDVSVRLLGETVPDPITGQVKTYFNHNPQQPFSSLAITFERGVLTPVANPLLCGTPEGAANFEPNAAPGKEAVDKFGVTVAGCAPTTPFNPAQSTANTNSNAGGNTSFTLNLARSDGEQYIGAVRTVLPPGLVGKISAAERCAEPAASSETIACPAGSQIGTATVLAGAGEPFKFEGPVYLTGPVNGAPYGMSIKVPAVAGPFDLGTVVTRAGINVEPYTSQAVVESELPEIRSGIPLRIRNISVAINKPGFMINPTNCGALSTVSTLGGFTLTGEPLTATKTLSTPFQVANCSALKFTPKFKASSSAHTSRADGAMLTTEITEPAGQANIKSVKVQLPRQLPSRLTTLQKACTEQVFDKNPLRCPSGAFVGGATVKTPVLPQPLKGPAIFVSHGGAAFPDLDLVVEDPNHLRVILVGNTNIKNNITTTTFASTPDVPVSSVRVELPIGAHSAVASYGSLCAKSLVMPTTITSQNGKTIKQNTIINVAGCGVQIVGRKVVGSQVWVTVRAPAAGRISAGGINLVRVYKHSKKAFQLVTLKVPLSGIGRVRRRPLPVRIRVGFVPKHGRASVAYGKVTFR